MTDILQNVVQTLEKTLNTKQVFGEPLEIAGVTLVPVMDLTYGFGGGSGEGRNKENEGGTGGGGGGAARLAPKAIIVIHEGNVSVMPVVKGGTVDRIIDAIPGLVERFMPKKADDKAEPDTQKG